MRFILLFLSSLLLALPTTAQDVILQTDGAEVPGKVLAITPERVTYVSAAADTLQLPAAQVFLIRYANGTKEVLRNLATPAPAPTPAISPTEAYAQGRHDARVHFKAPGAFWGTFGATAVSIPVLGGLGGLATGTAIAVTPPKEHNLNVPDRQRQSDANYMRGYEKQAQRKKVGKAAAGFGTGLVTGAALWLLIAFSTIKHI
ncbi:hypothetical protein MUN84_09920 [Hymenobacter sp. 5516J-16]|uniref:Uncharacterized protein n=1 Tax=Hymenobacter sublimis TaxID=2933777 RepID=A0ABY4J9Z6_9BACT|nr:MULTISPECIES: hypothetical protein [Hymenobacter]UOQ78816.1 hypothetical protein MUN84_09920 [Hymenobacter sp. 5516J-16]UPL48777.1 hypothetical protein MWH26_16500 [Hymenobacter sublimis]